MKQINSLSEIKLHGQPIAHSRRKAGFLGFYNAVLSVIDIYEKYVKLNGPLKYLLTYKMSQDQLELFFVPLGVEVGGVRIRQQHSLSSTHLTQPLDVAVFRPMKRAWRQLLLKWKKTDGRQLPTIPKGCYPKLLKLLIDELQMNASKNIIAGFKKTGISPLNEHEILARLPGEDLDENHENAVEDSVVTLLKEMRYSSMNIVEPRKRKLNVLPGKSVAPVAPEEIEEL